MRFGIECGIDGPVRVLVLMVELTVQMLFIRICGVYVVLVFFGVLIIIRVLQMLMLINVLMLILSVVLMVPAVLVMLVLMISQKFTVCATLSLLSQKCNLTEGG